MSSPPRNILADRERAILCVGLAVGFLFCMVLAWLPLRMTIFRFVFEDAFYYLCVARNMIDGNGSSFDGIHPTNGYHPLWMLVSLLLMFPFRLGSETAFHLLLSLCCVFHVVTAFFIYRTVLLGKHRAVAVIAALAWLLNYNVAGIAMCGLETSVFAFLVVATVYSYLLRRNDLSGRQSAVIGVMVGLTALARFDGALLGIALAADQLCHGLFRKERLTRLARRVAPMSLAGSAMMVPWMLWSHSVSGTILPNSHRAVRLWYGPDELLSGGLLKGIIGILMNHAPVMAKLYGFVPFSSTSVVLFVVFLGVLVVGRERRTVGLPVIIFVIYPILHILYYTRYFAPYNRYLYPAHLLIFTGTMTVVGCWLLGNRNGRLARLLGAAVGVVMVTNLIVSSVDTWKQGTASVSTHSAHWTMFNKALPWIQANVQPHEKVGAFNSGIYGYFSGRTIVNLDGVMNDSVIPALEGGWLIPYLYQERITYVVDWEITVEDTFEDLGGIPDYRSRFAVIETFEQPWGLYTGARLIVLRLIY